MVYNHLAHSFTKKLQFTSTVFLHPDEGGALIQEFIFYLPIYV